MRVSSMAVETGGGVGAGAGLMALDSEVGDGGQEGVVPWVEAPSDGDGAPRRLFAPSPMQPERSPPGTVPTARVFFTGRNDPDHDDDPSNGNRTNEGAGTTQRTTEAAPEGTVRHFDQPEGIQSGGGGQGREGGLVAPEDRSYRRGAGMHGQVKLMPWTVLRAAEDSLATTHAAKQDQWQLDARAESSAMVEEMRSRRGSTGIRSGTLETVLGRRGSLTDDRRILLRAAVDREAGRMGVGSTLPHLEGARTAAEAANTPSMRSFRRQHETHSEATKRTRRALVALKSKRASAAAARAQPSLRERAR